MAIWQYAFFILPANSLKKLSLKFYLTKNEDDLFDDEPFWIKEPVRCNQYDSIESILPQTKSWHKDLKIYGDLESHCFEVSCKEGMIVSVSFRIDFSKDYRELLKKLVDFFSKMKIVPVDQKLNILELDASVLKRVIEQSNEFKRYF